MKQKRVSGILRLLVGFYLCYLAYGLLNQFQFGKFGKDMLSSVFGVLYLVMGVGLMVWGGFGYYKASKQEEEE